MSESYKFLPDVPLDAPKKAEDLITKNLLGLSFEDRNAIDEEIHGVNNLSREETPALLQESMVQLSLELSKIQNKAGFDKSQRLFPYDTFVNTIDFRLRFLRCEFLDAQKAATRMVTYLDILDELFDGDWVLQRPIELSDFSKAEMKILRSGIYQLLPYRDRSGRAIFTELGDMGLHLDLKTRMKIRAYFYYIASNDVETQRKGMVFIGWAEGDFTSTPMPLSTESRRLYRCMLRGMPVRRTAVHFCVPDTLYFRLLSSFFVTVIVPSGGSNSLVRSRLHVVEGIERRYRLQSFGIPVETIPITETGNIKRSYLYQWIKVRKIIESKQRCRDEQGNSIILLPNSNDVLIRVGTKNLSHPGNVFFRGMVEMKHNEFREGSQFTQSLLAQAVVEEIERLGGRFLTWNNIGYWTELRDRRQVIFKVEVSIRDVKTKIRARKNPQITHSSTNRFERQDGTGRKRKAACDCNSDSSDTEKTDSTHDE